MPLMVVNSSLSFFSGLPSQAMSADSSEAVTAAHRLCLTTSPPQSLPCFLAMATYCVLTLTHISRDTCTLLPLGWVAERNVPLALVAAGPVHVHSCEGHTTPDCNVRCCVGLDRSAEVAMPIKH